VERLRGLIESMCEADPDVADDLHALAEGRDVDTPRGVTAKLEVRRLRRRLHQFECEHAEEGEEEEQVS
jgi:hypothetical protein